MKLKPRLTLANNNDVNGKLLIITVIFLQKLR